MKIDGVKLGVWEITSISKHDAAAGVRKEKINIRLGYVGCDEVVDGRLRIVVKKLFHRVVGDNIHIVHHTHKWRNISEYCTHRQTTQRVGM